MEIPSYQIKTDLSKASENNSNNQLLLEVQILYDLLPMAQWIHLVAAIATFGILFQHIEQDILLSWVGFFLFIICLRIIISDCYQKGEKTSNRAQYWFNLYLVGTILYGIMWSGTAIYLVPFDSTSITGFTGLLLCGVTAGFVAVSSVNLKVYFAFAVSTMCPYAALLIIPGQYPQVIYGWLIMLFFVVVTLMAIRVNIYFSDLIKLQLKTAILEEEIRYENYKRKMIEKALLDNTLEEELAELIRHQAKSLRNDLSSIKQGSVNSSRTHLVSYKSYLDRLNDVLVNQVSSAKEFITQIKSTSESEELKKHLSIIEKILYDVVSTIKKLDIGEQVENNKDSLKIKEIDLHRLLIYITHEIPLLYKSKYITIQRHIDSDIPKIIYGDRNVLKNILNLLIINSFQYMDGGVIEINAKKESEDENEIVIQFEIIDTGVGIPKEIIDEFLSDSEPDAEVDSGFARVKKYVRMSGGLVNAKSTLGVGSSIGFSMPFIKESQAMVND
jgi:signal transduction histidine kinase